MPKFLERKLKAEAAKKGKTGRDAARYVYGAMNNMGAMKGNQTTAKGERMEEQHEKKSAHNPREERRERAPHPGGYGARLRAGLK